MTYAHATLADTALPERDFEPSRRIETRLRTVRVRPHDAQPSARMRLE
jgi:hypothetical protein